ncbi:carbonic anhydrase XVb [Chelmon rostratus]|uniref:carbonic anhydrase XVb n=1 Tax=Chelmon rostratus TaxID=109905 RepID=UPI001BE8C207|nr:carbonic anhydrase XVb [Chelmon rostratus]
MNWLVAAFALCVLAPTVHCASGAVIWCYHLASCKDTAWPLTIPAFCNGTRQSPINIISSSAKPNANLTAFTFNNYSSINGMKKIENTGKTVKVILDNGLGFSGGDLSEPYDSLQFHLHWGNGTAVPGSEHTLNGKRYPMELHIVSSKASHNKNTTLAVADSTGVAALGFFVEAMTGNETGQPESWRNLTSYLDSIKEGGTSAPISPGFSLDDLLTGVDRTKYYRYLGSLTTPTCNEAVVWTVFKDTIKVSKDLIELFSTVLHIGNSSSPLMTKVFRELQPEQPVTTQPASSSSTKTCYSLGLMALSLALGRS